ncbi:hypothetical protein AVEN_65155-1 [Araneus ventricosus]|uniref:Uncharacterized protein n=1 Tax=Araneus ventricosus TaxID=182803 RepID=A0A4Y2AFH6_ARAVE|nr:hypothetical protein AVEN_65155-1 [Araneus ventricosus]
MILAISSIKISIYLRRYIAMIKSGHRPSVVVGRSAQVLCPSVRLSSSSNFGPSCQKGFVRNSRLSFYYEAQNTPYCVSMAKSRGEDTPAGFI